MATKAKKSNKITYSEPRSYFNADMRAAVKKALSEKKNSKNTKKG